ncbi:ABC transporter substrate-binding protein [Amycolatopsis endophytica]|uniref:Peptide/nickel transport system substrate-binding protein n=1 Tax=Amycolatopsis endophytica TaxID=860233 RepID=A0A853AZQ5_9PSEU|nr:ABC transporter substrate-binding protein [Amycolatopsis endophytica]NYI88097.1 peptide/nickel transport system substrate-binding protein [Amycolatopsis endophytica]
MSKDPNTTFYWTRRETLRFAAATALGLSAGVPVLAGCSVGSQGSATNAGPPPSQPTGTLRVAHLGDPTSLDPSLAGNAVSLPIISHNVYESLLGFDGDTSNLVGVLAERWESSPDAREWTFHLREGITFHDGAPLTSSAVKKTFQYYKRSGTQWGVLLPPNATFDDTNPRVIRVSSPDSFPDMGRNATLIRMISPNLVDQGPDAVNKTPTGTGPFRFESYTTAKSLVLSANRQFRGPGPYLERLQFQIIPDASARVAALRSGSVDLVFNVAPSDAGTLKSAGNLAVTEKPLWRVGQLILFSNHRPVDNVVLRRALAHGIDKEAIIKSILRGVGKRQDNVLPEGVYGYQQPATQYPYDPNKARELLAQSGLTTPVELEAVWSPELGENIGRVEQAISGMLSEIGVNLKATQIPFAEVTKVIVDPQQKPYHAVAGELGWLTGGPLFFATKYFQRTSEFAAMNDLNNKMLTTPDGPERLRLLAEIQELFAQQLPVIPLYNSVQVDGHSTSVQGYSSPKDGFQPNFGQVYLSQ